MKKKTGIELITEERQEQLAKHGWDLDHDKTHAHGELAKMGAALAVLHTDAIVVEQGEPLADDWALIGKLYGKKIHALKVAGALIAAEIDRLQAIDSTTLNLQQ